LVGACVAYFEIAMGDSESEQHDEGRYHSEPSFAAWEARARDYLARQPISKTFGLSVEAMSPGCCTLRMPYDGRLTRWVGLFHSAAVVGVAQIAAEMAVCTVIGVAEWPTAGDLSAAFPAEPVGAELEAQARVTGREHGLWKCQTKVFAQNRDRDGAILCGTATQFFSTENLAGRA
jgi:acyl-coenzyme A thioesterase PaaI-like protein